MRVKAFAKFNLNLHILPKRFDNGYTEIKAVNCRLSLFDELIFEKQSRKIKLIDKSGIPKEKNLVYKAAKLLKEVVKNEDLGVKIKLIKNIPIKAGLGGGSADCAVTILSLNKLWGLNFSLEKFAKIGGKLGSDIYYCLNKGVGGIGGYGEKIKIIAGKMPEIWGILVVPKEKKPSTKWAYEKIKREKIGKNLDKYFKIVKAIKSKDKKGIIDSLYNDFEGLMIKYFPIVKKIKDDFKKVGALNSLMAGSGLSVVGFFENKKMAEKGKIYLENKYKAIYLVRTV